MPRWSGALTQERLCFPCRRATTPGLVSLSVVRVATLPTLFVAALAGMGTLAIATAALAGSDSDTSPRGPFFYPTGPGPYRLRAVAGASLDLLPRRLVEAEQREVPRVTGGVRWGLPYGLSLDGRASVIVLSNEVQAGVAWSWGTDDVALALHERIGLWYGTIGVEGFDATGMGVLNTPGVSVGFPMRELRFTLGVQAIIVQAQSITVGGTTLRRNRLSFEGVEVPVTVESLLPSGGAFYYGFALIWAKPDYQLWLAFSDSEKRQLYPRFVAGYEF